jgi:Type I phosphodiesterase / nucleotide pyrophosphatase
MTRSFAAVVLLATLLAPAGATTWATDAANVVLVTLDGVRIQEMFGGLDESVARALVKDGRVEDTPLWQRYWAPTREERRRKLMPFLWGTLLAEHGSIAGDQAAGSIVRVTNRHRFSYPGYSEIATGAAHDAEIDSNDNRRNPFPTVLEIVRRERGLEPRQVATFASWETFRWIVEHEEGATTVNAGLQAYAHPERDVQVLSDWQFQTRTPWDGTRHDAYTLRFARAHLATFRPRLLWMAFDETDDWAHDGRYDRVLDALARFDAALADLWEWLQADPQYRGTTTVIVTTDHGRGRGPADWRDHGKDVEGAQDIWLVLAGRGVGRRGVWREAPTIHQNQIAATIAALLDVDYRQFVPGAGLPIADCLMSKEKCGM